MSQIANLSALKTPGVYVTEIDSFPPSVAEVDTAIPVFIGYTQKAFDPNNKNLPVDANGNNLINIPTAITSLLDYETYFGTAQLETGVTITITQTADANGNVLTETIVPSFTGPQSKHNMHAAIRFFYDNGGSTCYILSVGPYKQHVGDPLVIGDFTTSSLDLIRKEDEITLIVFPEGQNLAEADYYTLQNAALNLCADIRIQNKFCIMDLHDTGSTVSDLNGLNTALSAFRNNIAPTLFESLNYGAAYYPNLVTTYAPDLDETQTAIVHNVTTAGVTAPGSLNGAHLADLNIPPVPPNPPGPHFNLVMYNKIESILNTQFPRILPPSSAMAGIYTTVDSSRGVWKAPANVNVSAVTGPICKISDQMQEGMNVDPQTGKSVNAIRAFTGKGTLVWGGRTLLGNDNNWRYISVRRTYIMVESSVKDAAFQFVFEPNDIHTWLRVKAMIENFLFELWQQGALAGVKPEDAYYISVGLGKTMTAQDILEGRMIVEVGMAVVRPAEFIVLRFTQVLQQS